MKLEDLFKERLEDYQIKVDNTVWEKVNAKKSTSNPSTVKSDNALNKVVKANKTNATITKGVIAAVSTAALAGAGIIAYNNFKEHVPQTPIIENTDNNSPVNDDITAVITEDTLKTIKESKNKEDILPKDIFAIAEDSVNLDDNWKENRELDNFVIQPSDPVILKAVQHSDTVIKEPHFDTMRTKNDYQIKIKIPNVMTPNGDGINDCFVIRNIEDYPDNKLVIYTGNGKKIYSKEHYNNEYCPQNLQEGTYFYTLTVRINGFKKDFNGVITIIY